MCIVKLFLPIYFYPDIGQKRIRLKIYILRNVIVYIYVFITVDAAVVVGYCSFIAVAVIMNSDAEQIFHVNI